MTGRMEQCRDGEFEVESLGCSKPLKAIKGLGVRVKLGDSRSNGFRNIRGADFESNERTNMTKPILSLPQTVRDRPYVSMGS